MPKKSFFAAAFLAFLLACGFVLNPVVAEAATQKSRSVSFTKVKKKSKNFKAKYAKKKKAKAKAKAKKKAAPLSARSINPAPDVADEVSEPSEMILAIKNRAERAFWEGRKTLAEQRRGKAKNPFASESLTRASASDLTGVTFDDQPVRLPESAAFRRSLDTVAFELGRSCTRTEYFGWPLQQTEQKRVDSIFADTNEKFKLRGYSLTPHQPRAVGQDVSVFTVDRLRKHVMGLWSAGDVGLLLMQCETEAPKVAAPAPKEKAPAAKTRKAKKLVKLKKPKAAPEGATLPPVAGTADKPAAKTEAVPSEEKRPEVVPGATKETLQETKPAPDVPAPAAPAPSTPPAPEAVAPAPAAPTASPPQPARVPVVPQQTTPSSAFVPAPEAVVPAVKPAPVLETKPADAVIPVPDLSAAPKPAGIVTPAVPAASAAVDAAKDAAKDAVKEAVKDAATDAVKKELPAIPALPAP